MNSPETTNIILIVNFAWTVVWSLFLLWKVSKNKSTETLQDHGTRIDKIETKFELMPSKISSHQDVERVHKRVGDLRDKVADVAADSKATREIVDSLKGLLNKLVDNELEKGRKKQ